MREHGFITSMDAIYHLGCTRLAGRIYEIKQRGYNIETELVNVKTRYGTTKVAIYRLKEDGEKESKDRIGEYTYNQ